MRVLLYIPLRCNKLVIIAISTALSQQLAMKNHVVSPSVTLKLLLLNLNRQQLLTVATDGNSWS